MAEAGTEVPSPTALLHIMRLVDKARVGEVEDILVQPFVATLPDGPCRDSNYEDQAHE